MKMAQLILSLIILCIPTILLAQTMPDASKLVYAQQKNNNDWYSKTLNEIEDAYNKKEISKYEYLDLRIKLQQENNQFFSNLYQFTNR